MDSGWNDRDAGLLVEHYARDAVGADMALRIYTTRLLGRVPALVQRGGGNSSVKTQVHDLLGEQIDALCVKGSGWDMATIEPAGLPAVRLAPLLRLRDRNALTDAEMVRIQRACLIDPMAPNPSVETLLHAFLPHKYVDHTHATAVLSLTNQPDGEELCREVYADRLGVVPYVMPGFALARKAAEIYEQNPRVEGLILLKHGIFSFGTEAREAYERMIDAVSRAETRLRRGRKSVFIAAPLPARTASLAEVAPIIRGACSLKDAAPEGIYRRLILEFRVSTAILAFVNGAAVRRYGRAGVITPDHTIRTKNWPLVVGPPEEGKTDAFKADAQAAATAFIADYESYFARHNAGCHPPKRMLDPLPRVVLVPGLGLFGLGRTKKDASIAADLAETAIATITDAEAIGQFESIHERDMFDMEYWSLEQAKLGKEVEKPLAGQVALVTGGGGAIGGAIAHAFATTGAEVAILDVDESAARTKAREIAALAVGCDVTDGRSVRAAFDRVAETFGGVDIVVSNAGGAWQGRIGEVDDATLRRSFELNFFAHQCIAQNAVRLMLAQGTGGALLFNVSKQAVNPGANFGPYGIPKAATLFLVRQYALEYGSAGIRANAVNADRVRSGLLTPELIASRASARGLSEHAYMAGNLLGREVTAEDVAQAFLFHALALKTTGDVTTVDGGNIAAALR
jgi:rhamnose utilization protein RhaD (predicted bifunctional aldolase and dehydrogenase)/NAD(P)-dependent dehydrogenase (short-subunit alcohol dehydrogenase family)